MLVEITIADLLRTGVILWMLGFATRAMLTDSYVPRWFIMWGAIVLAGLFGVSIK